MNIFICKYYTLIEHENPHIYFLIRKINNFVSNFYINNLKKETINMDSWLLLFQKYKRQYHF